MRKREDGVKEAEDFGRIKAKSLHESRRYAVMDASKESLDTGKRVNRSQLPHRFDL